MEIDLLTRRVIGAAMRVHTELGPGFLESVYEKALLYELHKGEIPAIQQQPIPVYYDGLVVGDFIADLYVPDCLVIELKAVQTLAPIHSAQLINYLQATGIDDGLLFNFGAESLEFHRKRRLYKHPHRG